MWLTNGLWLNLLINQWSKLRVKETHSQSHKEVWEPNTSAITVEFKVTQDQIVISLKHWRIQVLKGQEDQNMEKGIGLLSNQKVKKVIPKWGMWCGWLMHSPPVWKVSPEGLKVTTIVPNPLGISPQTQVSCTWRRVHMHKHYNMSIHQYFLCFVTLIICVTCVISPTSVEIFFVPFALNVFTFFFNQSFLAFMSKIQKHIKSRKSKKFDRHYCELSQAFFALYLCTNGFVHLRA